MIIVSGGECEGTGYKNENEKVNESKNIEYGGEDEEADNCTIISRNTRRKREDLLDFSSDDENIVPDENGNENGVATPIKNGS